MLCLGLSGGLNRVHENPFELPGALAHDGAAVLVEDGRVVAAIEEERLNRIKHSNKFPLLAIRQCLTEAKATFGDIDRIAFYATEAYCNTLLDRIFLGRPDVSRRPRVREAVGRLLEEEFGTPVDADRIAFVGHHMAHAVSAFALSGFEESLVVAVDGYGDFLSGMIGRGHGTSVDELATFPQSDSLGLLYQDVIRFVGYGPFDEYKVMGLAPYGDPAAFREIIASFYELLPRGGYRLHLERIAPTLIERMERRSSGTPFTQQHMDLSAALQEALERIVFHVLHHWRHHTGLRNLCLAGGVAHNCSMNGRILSSGLFDDVFVQPAAHDAGCALGAALMMSGEGGHPAPRRRLEHVFWGSPLDEDAEIERKLAAWSGFLDHVRADDVAHRAARLVADGAVIGWVQGRSEFGPRALGNRSIVADPRPASNKDRVNMMVKKREGYRPFAPSVLEEHASDYFELPPGRTDFPFMIFVVKVREEKRAQLGAITHVDGTARLQTVSQETNPRYWRLIDEFGRLTGVPVVLNTSFNNNAEPIVDSTDDAIVTFLTTGLDYLVVGSFLVAKRAVETRHWSDRVVSLPPHVQLQQFRRCVGGGRMETRCEIRSSASSRTGTRISPGLHDALMQVGARELTVGEVLEGCATSGEADAALAELRDLWAERLVRIGPAGGPAIDRSDDDGDRRGSAP